MALLIDFVSSSAPRRRSGLSAGSRAEPGINGMMRLVIYFLVLRREKEVAFC